MRTATPLAALGAAALLALGVAEAGAQSAPDTDLTPQELAEKDSRKACKIELCATFRDRVARGPDIACDILKTWREEDIADIVSGGKLEWPWGAAKCEARLTLAREPLVKAVTEKRYEMSLPPHTVACELDRKSAGRSYRVQVSMAPTVTFENGRAVKGAINWGGLEAPVLAYGAIWPATGLDNKANVLGGKLVEMVNEFLTTKCDEVENELPAAKPAG